MVNKMLTIAMDKVSCLETTAAGLPGPQVTVLLTKKGNIVVAENDIDGAVCAQLRAQDDAQIEQSVTVWKGGHIDLPSYQFRKMLVDLDERNRDALLIVQGKDGIFTKKLHQTVLSC